MHSTSILSNGYVTLAPKRMELVAAPPQDGYAIDWISELTLHEYRHAVQLGKLNQGFTRAASWLTGEIAPGVVSSLIPSWFYEGDAVYNETRLTETGRGRIPGFEMPLRTLLMQQSRTFSYDKAVFGSYRDYVPDQYRYGYQLVTHARSRYGDAVWSKALDYTARNPFFIWPLAFYLKKNYGIYKSGLYRQTMDSLKRQYNNQKESFTYIDYSTVNSGQRRVFTSYILPKEAENGLLLAMRKGLDDPGSFVTIDSSGKVKKVFTTGLTTGLKCDVWGNLLVWDEVRTDPRWGQRDFSVLQTYDLSTGEKTAFSNRTRYFSPDFSPGGKQIAVAETDTENRNYLTLLNATTGKMERQLPSPKNKALQFPEWLSDSEIVVITVSDAGKQLEHIDLKTNQWTVLLPNTRFDISEPTHYKNYILFRSSYNGIENIFAISKTQAAPIYQVTFSRFGAFHPSVSHDSASLLFSNYSHAGFDVVSLPLDTLSWRAIGAESFVGPDSPEIAPGKQPVPDRGEQPAAVSYPVKPYGRLSKSVNLHSWVPFYADLEDFTGSLQQVPINLGVMAFSQNLLSTVISRIGYRYYEGNHEFIPVFAWRGWYPVLEVSGKFGGPAPEVLAKTYVPLSFTRGKYITRIQPQAEYEHTGTAYYVGDDLQRGIHYLHGKFFLNHYLRYSSRDLYPRWGQFMAAYLHANPRR